MTDSEAAYCSKTQSQLSWACSDHASPSECPDALVGRIHRSGRYGIYIHDGGTSLVEINFCPWCGSKLPIPRQRTNKS